MARSSRFVSSAQWWLMPPMEGTNSIAAGIRRAMYCASWPAPLGMCIHFPGASASAASASACCSRESQGAGVDRLTTSSVAVQRSRRLLSRTARRSTASSRSSTAGSRSRNWNRISARPG